MPTWHTSTPWTLTTRNMPIAVLHKGFAPVGTSTVWLKLTCLHLSCSGAAALRKHDEHQEHGYGHLPAAQGRLPGPAGVGIVPCSNYHLQALSVYGGPDQVCACRRARTNGTSQTLVCRDIRRSGNAPQAPTSRLQSSQAAVSPTRLPSSSARRTVAQLAFFSSARRQHLLTSHAIALESLWHIQTR